MDNDYLQDLLTALESNDGGMLLKAGDTPRAVVLGIDRYNALLEKNAHEETGELEQDQPATEAALAASSTAPQTPKKSLTVLVTGGAGYIGSHAVRQLIKDGHRVIVADNLVTGRRENVPEVALFLEGDIGDPAFLEELFSTNAIDVVMHFAASIEVEESVRDPRKYLENNTIATVALLNAMARYGVKKIVFSSTAAVYGEPNKIPIAEDAPLAPINPYGYSKLLAEQVVQYFVSYHGFTGIVFRYFNACGSDFDGTLFSTHASHLIPLVMDVVAGRREFLTVFGNDYDTQDGTCVRDYVHVLDIAAAHAAAIPRLLDPQYAGTYEVYNIGTGKGASIEQVVRTASEVTNRMIPLEMGPRRPGDPAALVADNTKLKQDLHFELRFSDLPTIIKTSLRK